MTQSNLALAMWSSVCQMYSALSVHSVVLEAKMLH